MAPYKATTLLGKKLEAKWEPWLTEDLSRYADAIGVMFQAVLEVAEEEGEDGTAGFVPPWGKLFEVKACPAKDLQYLAQYVGVELMKEASAAEKREAIEKPAGWERGTVAAIEKAIKSVNGAAAFVLQERTSKAGGEAAYHFNVVVGTGKSSAKLKEAIEEVKPGGIMFSIIEGKNLWLQGAKTWAAIAAGVKWNKPIVEGEY